jgi:protein SSD1
MDRDAVAKVTQQCNMYVSLASQLSHPHSNSVNSKRDSAILAREQSAHLFLCVLISDLTSRYGPVIRQAKVIGVLDAAFDVLIPEFGIEKRVHVDQMPIDVRCCCFFDAHRSWSPMPIESCLRRALAHSADLLVRS